VTRIHKLSQTKVDPWKSKPFGLSLCSNVLFLFVSLAALKKKTLKKPLPLPLRKKHIKNNSNTLSVAFLFCCFFSPLAKKQKNAYANSYHLSKNSKSLQVWWGRN